MLIRKMEAGRKWAQMRDEWPGLGFAKRSAVDLKDKWRNLEDVVLQGKVMRTVQLSEEHKQRIHRCYRKYRFMTPATSPDQSSFDQSHSSLQQQQAARQNATGAVQPGSSDKQQSSDSYRPTDDHGSPARQQNDDHTAAHTPMTRSRARAQAAQQKKQVRTSGES